MLIINVTFPADKVEDKIVISAHTKDEFLSDLQQGI